MSELPALTWQIRLEIDALTPAQIRRLSRSHQRGNQSYRPS